MSNIRYTKRTYEKEYLDNPCSRPVYFLSVSEWEFYQGNLCRPHWKYVFTPLPSALVGGSLLSFSQSASFRSDYSIGLRSLFFLASGMVLEHFARNYLRSCSRYHCSSWPHKDKGQEPSSFLVFAFGNNWSHSTMWLSPILHGYRSCSWKISGLYRSYHGRTLTLLPSLLFVVSFIGALLGALIDKRSIRSLQDKCDRKRASGSFFIYDLISWSRNLPRTGSKIIKMIMMVANICLHHDCNG